ncbi:hypothetical protein Vadar_027146 [Vaccinium darrowii]|uniref:Uncharacterized protein n=1 Tax=Vaccinium darrowii TaxID=229202 RepID=A0ACB7YZL9_9ERIC|nr:hypothetical protein Vadar_027146 [Vaccinium darrowii]
MARAHLLGQTNKVMIFSLITRGTIEERMMQMTKKKMVLEHLVVGRLKAQNINQEELDDIIRYSSRNYLLMKMMKRENLGKFIMMMRPSIGYLIGNR